MIKKLAAIVFLIAGVANAQDIKPATCNIAGGTIICPSGSITPGTGSGTVTSVSVTTANGVSGSIANPTTTPAISLTLGAITPSSAAIGGATIGSDVLAWTGTATGSGKLKLGGGSYTSDDTAILINRTAVNPLSSGGSHAIRDESIYTLSSGTGGYASFDSNPAVSGSIAYNHLRSFQARPQYSGTNTISEVSGFTFQLTTNSPSAVNTAYGLNIIDALSTGPITTQAGVFCGALTRASTNLCIYSASSTVGSYFGGSVAVGGASIGTNSLGVTGTTQLGGNVGINAVPTSSALTIFGNGTVDIGTSGPSILRITGNLAAFQAYLSNSPTQISFNPSGGNLAFGVGPALITSPVVATLQHGAADVASGAIAQTLTFQGNTASTTNGPLALIQGAGGGSSTSVGGELRLSGGLSSAAAGTGGAVTVYAAPAAAGNVAALVATFAANKATTLAGTLTVSGITNVATTSALCYNTGTGLITYDGTLGTCTVSDERLKNMGERIPSALDRLLQINGVYYTWKDSSLGSGRQIGVGAQTVEKVFPELVQTDINGRKSADYQRLTAPIIEALRELKADNDNLRLEVNELKRVAR